MQLQPLQYAGAAPEGRARGRREDGPVPRQLSDQPMMVEQRGIGHQLRPGRAWPDDCSHLTKGHSLRTHAQRADHVIRRARGDDTNQPERRAARSRDGAVRPARRVHQTSDHLRSSQTRNAPRLSCTASMIQNPYA